MLRELGVALCTTAVNEDSARAIAWATGSNQEQMRRTKYIDTQYHVVQSKLNDRTNKLLNVTARVMEADLLTKTVGTR